MDNHFLNSKQCLFSNLALPFLDHAHQLVLTPEGLQEGLTVGVEPAELAEVEAGDGAGDGVLGVQHLDQFLDEGVLVALEFEDVLLPEVLRVAGPPAKVAGLHLLTVLLEGRENPVVLLQNILQIFQVLLQLDVLSILFDLVVDNFLQIVVYHQFNASSLTAKVLKGGVSHSH